MVEGVSAIALFFAKISVFQSRIVTITKEFINVWRVMAEQVSLKKANKNMENSYSSLSVAIEALQKEGYTVDFNLVEEGVEAKSLKNTWKAGDLEVVRYYRFEGMTNPGDNTILYLIETNDGNKGLLVDAYGADTGPVSKEMIDKLKIQHE
tara:strand:- start:13975 stop:14427 length:453 start_codon:yes stop_codon:yes gene_type:complete